VLYEDRYNTSAAFFEDPCGNRLDVAIVPNMNSAACASIKYKEFIPHTVLQDDIKRFWILEKEYTPEVPTEEVTPDACIELILNFGSAYVQISGAAPRQLPEVCLFGLQSSPLLFQASGVVKIVAARFFAWGTLSFLKHKVQPGGTEDVELDQAWRGVISKMRAKVHSDEYQKAVEEFEDFLVGQRLNALFGPRQVRAAAKLLYHTKGQFRVAELADRLNLSARQLERQFDEATGVSPKTLARTIRFDAIRNRLMFQPEANLTELAYEFGYSDQAHFIHDFKAFTNKTPSEFAAEMLKLQEIFHDRRNVVFLQSPPTALDYSAPK
jgi:AraC-like DNA-binding protein